MKPAVLFYNTPAFSMRPGHHAFPLTFVLLLALATGGSACLPSEIVLEAATATNTPSPSATILWFPPSATPTPLFIPTRAPTPERRPGVGEVLLRDNFSSAELWNTVASPQATVEVSHGHLTIAVGPGAGTFSLRQGEVFTDFYAEVTAHLNLCRGEDDYGLLVRASAVSAYRFALSCNGTTRAERVSVRTRLPLHPPVLSADAPPGAPAEVRLGVWAVGAELRFFLNGRYQFSLHDKSYPSGTLGVFARALGKTPVTVTFSDLVVYAVNYSPPLPTQSP